MSGPQPEYVGRLRSLVAAAGEALSRIPDPESVKPLAPGKWSAREVVGHLIDSASNNHQRFVRAQFQADLEFPGYDQDAWVSAQNYAEAPWPDLVQLWIAFNTHLARVMDAVPEAVRVRPVTKHNLDQIAWATVPAEHPTTLDYFMADYVDHLEHHLRQILGDGTWLEDA